MPVLKKGREKRGRRGQKTVREPRNNLANAPPAAGLVRKGGVRDIGDRIYGVEYGSCFLGVRPKPERPEQKTISRKTAERVVPKTNSGGKMKTKTGRPAIFGIRSSKTSGDAKLEKRGIRKKRSSKRCCLIMLNYVNGLLIPQTESTVLIRTQP